MEEAAKRDGIWSCAACGPHPDSKGWWCAKGCGRDYNRMTFIPRVMVSHVHEWHRPKGPYMVIDTYPPEYPYLCECGAFTHDPETGEPCEICAPNDPRIARA